MSTPTVHHETLAARLAWLPAVSPDDCRSALSALPSREAAHDYAAAEDSSGFCRFATLIGTAMAHHQDDDDIPSATPVMILVMATPDGELFQVPEDTTSQITIWAGACLSQCDDTEHAIGGIGLQLSQSLSGAAFALAGESEWTIAGSIPAGALPEVPAPRQA